MSSGFQSVAQREAAPDRKAWLLVAFTWVAYCLNYRPASHLLDVSHSEIHTAFYGCAARADGRYSYGSTGLCWPICWSDRRPVFQTAAGRPESSSMERRYGPYGPVAFGGDGLACRALTGVTVALFVPAAVPYWPTHTVPKTGRALSRCMPRVNWRALWWEVGRSSPWWDSWASRVRRRLDTGVSATELHPSPANGRCRW